MAGWKIEFLLLQQDLVDRRKVRSARRTQKKATGEVLTWRKQGRKEGAGFQVFRNRCHCRCDCHWRYRGCARKAWVLEKNFWFRLTGKNPRGIDLKPIWWSSRWRILSASVRLASLWSRGRTHQFRGASSEVFICSSALFASNPNPNLVWEPRLSSRSTRVFGAFCLLFTIFLWSSHAHVSIEHFLAGHRSNQPSSSFCTAAAYGWEFKSMEWSWPQFSAERRVCDCNSCVTLCWNLFCSDDSHLNLNLFQFALEWSASYVALQQHCCKRRIAFYFLPVFVV